MAEPGKQGQTQEPHRPDTPASQPVQLLVELDPPSLQMTLVFNGLSLEIGLAMARWAADELKRQTDRAWLAANETRIALPGPLPPFPDRKS